MRLVPFYMWEKMMKDLKKKYLITIGAIAVLFIGIVVVHFIKGNVSVKESAKYSMKMVTNDFDAPLLAVIDQAGEVEKYIVNNGTVNKKYVTAEDGTKEKWIFEDDNTISVWSDLPEYQGRADLEQDGYYYKIYTYQSREADFKEKISQYDGMYVLFDSAGNIDTVFRNDENQDTMTDEEMQEKASKIVEKGKHEGWYKNNWYELVEKDGYKAIIFIDQSNLKAARKSYIRLDIISFIMYYVILAGVLGAIFFAMQRIKGKNEY